jgi:hypothetical protein
MSLIEQHGGMAVWRYGGNLETMSCGTAASQQHIHLNNFNLQARGVEMTSQPKLSWLRFAPSMIRPV